MSFKKNWTATGDKEIVRNHLSDCVCMECEALRYKQTGRTLSMQRTKPYIGSNDKLDEINEHWAEYEKAQHDADECLEDCQHCAAVAYLSRVEDEQLHLTHQCQTDECPVCQEAKWEVDAEAKHYQQSVFDVLEAIFKDTPIRNPWSKGKP